MLKAGFCSGEMHHCRFYITQLEIPSDDRSTVTRSHAFSPTVAEKGGLTTKSIASVGSKAGVNVDVLLSPKKVRVLQRG